MGWLTTHVLDTSNGKPAADMSFTLYRMEGGAQVYLEKLRTNADGRCDNPLLEGADFVVGTYELAFEVGDYFAAQGNPGAKKFLDYVTLRFIISDEDAHYHVPLLVSPFSYSTYRGS